VLRTRQANLTVATREQESHVRLQIELTDAFYPRAQPRPSPGNLL